jgi:hypothetical protein
MSWYSSPLQPLDPVVQSQVPKPPIRYMRDNFQGTGQNSYFQAPAQDQSMWQSLLNVQPITQGILNQRWGYGAFVSNLTLTLSNVAIVSISSPGTFIPIAAMTVASTAGLIPGQSITIAGNSDSFFNGTFTILTISSSTTLSITIPAVSAAHSGTGGTLSLNASITGNRLYNFQSDSRGTRAIIAAGLAGVVAYNENGSIYNGDVFAPVATTGIIRSITSRNYQYFCDGDNALNPLTHLTGDSLKWNGATTGGVTNIGISTTDVTTNNAGGGTTGNTLGPNTGTTATDQADFSNAWTRPSGIFSNSPAAAAYSTVSETITSTFNVIQGGQVYTVSNIKALSDNLRAITFGFTSVPNPTIAGIQVSLTYQATSFGTNANLTAGATLLAQLVKNGSVTGVSRGAGPLILDGNSHTVNAGSATDIWGGSFAPSDILSSMFGFQFQANGLFNQTGTLPTGTYNPGVTVNVSYVTITVYLGGTSGSATTSGNGVGILNGVAGGAINLTLGRIYYLTANNSLTGHYSDLSTASASTGSCTNSEFNLLLATYNDPQVDTKYVLATPDGGDPSILYEASVLVPGLTIASWAINGSNQVTFTGTYTGPQYTNGATFVVGGLSHGSYMNGQTMTVTGSSPTTVVASFTHGADSATEIGIAGNYSFAIPNGVTYVIDNTTDPLLVLNQPLLFTDTSGNEFGVTLNSPPPAGNLLIKHQGRLWMAGVPGATHSVFFSKSVVELTLPNGFIAGKYEEAWPGSNYFDVSDGAESVSGFLSDGTTLYIGTQNHIRRLLGNSPTTFQEPQIVHPEVGLINQEVWQLTFMQGAPSGSIWMTPDFRVIQSDFNTYVDIGTPVQDILNALQPTAPVLAHAAFVADGEYELYILAVPYHQSTYCDTELVFDLRTRQWFVWQPAGGSLSLLYNVTQAAIPQWLFINGTGNAINIFSSTATTDGGTTIPVSATTTWMHLGEATRRKMLNEIQVYGNTAMTMSVYGSNNLADFTSSPRPVVYNRALQQSPFGTWNLYLTGDRTRYRYYQFTFNANNGRIPFLGSYAISAIPMDDL